ncbi:MAG TPA: DVUA0089 family protein [Phycisphaerales bacterium]|nr:DVUA0089 family protein [Phycisphaerales bacterium]
MRTLALALSAGGLAAAASADVVIQPAAIHSYSTQRSCVPTVNVINGAGLTGANVTSNAPIPAAWPAHGTSGCNNMWHTTCIGQDNSTCEGGPTADLAPFIVFDLGAAWDLTGFRLWNHNQVAPGGASETNRGIRNMEVSVSEDGVNFSSAVPFTDVAQAPGSTAYTGDSYGLVATGVRYVRLQVTQNWGSTAVTGMSEIRFTGNGQFGIGAVAATPGTIELCGPQSVLLTASVGGTQNSTGVMVTASGGPLELPAVMNDGGLGGDATAGDGVYSVSVTFPEGFAVGVSTLSVSASDQQGNSASGSTDVTVGGCVPTYVEDGDAGDLPSTAAVASGTGPLQRIRGSLSGSDVDMYKVTVCDGEIAMASTFEGTTLDTQLFLFNADGVGVAFNDDVPDGFPGDLTLQSTLTGVLENGDYYLAVTCYDRDPQDASAQALWIDTPFNTVRAPDGPGGANPVDSWTGAFTATGDYTLTLQGACFVSDARSCPADIGITGGVPGQDGELNNNDFVVFIDYFFANNPLADRGSTGGVPGADGQWNNNDFVVFIDQFFAGCV